MKQVLVIPALALFLAACGGPVREGDAPATVEHVDLVRYTGTWHEIAKIPNRFQAQCVADTTATYSLREDGRIDVLNRCQLEGGEYDQAHGVARVVDPDTNAKLEVSFVHFLGRQWFWGDYWVIGLAEDYSWVVIGHPERTYGWVLAREHELGEEAIGRIEQILAASGYEVEQFVPDLKSE
jgi:apolipoprotein D and lipocalin family protein